MKNSELIYICSPLRGNGKTSTEKNAERARYYCRMVAMLHPDIIPIAPHIYFPQFVSDDDPAGRAYGMAKGLALLDMCSAIAVKGLGKEEPSEGMNQEIRRAKEKGIRIIDLDELITPDATPAGMDAAAGAGMGAAAPLLHDALPDITPSLAAGITTENALNISPMIQEHDLPDFLEKGLADMTRTMMLRSAT